MSDAADFADAPFESTGYNLATYVVALAYVIHAESVAHAVEQFYHLAEDDTTPNVLQEVPENGRVYFDV